MPPTEDELAELRRLVSLADGALKSDNELELNRALAGFRRLAMSLDPETRRLADQGHDAANNANMAAGIAELQAVAAKLGTLGEAFDNAAAVAVAGKEGLFFPKAAKKAEEALGKLANLKQEIQSLRRTLTDEAEALGQTVGNIKELKDLPDAAEKLETALKALKEKIDKRKG